MRLQGETVAIQVIPVPDIGGAEDVDVIEICVALGDSIEAEQSLIVLESDKASMEVPSPLSGKVVSLKINEGDKVSEGDVIVELEVGEAGTDKSPAAAPPVEQPAPAAESAAPENPAAASESGSAGLTASELPVSVPDIGGAEAVDVIEVCVSEGDEISEGDSLIVLESDKASMEVPSPAGGKVLRLTVAEGDKVSEGDAILTLAVVSTTTTSETTTSGATADPVKAAASETTPASAPVSAPPKPVAEAATAAGPQRGAGKVDEVYAGPSVRKLARQLGVDLSQVKPSGPRSRHIKNDIREYVKNLVAEKGKVTASGGSGIPPIPEVDFSRFGEIELVKMSKIKKLTATNMSRNWLNVPHVTQFDEADITELESFRKEMKTEAEKRGIKLTPLAFLLKASAAALSYEPTFNVSMHADGEHIVQKKYVHIGIAVATPSGLMMPVIRNVDKKGLWELAAESSELAKKARDGKLLPRDMQGACFSISSLGSLGGTGFTPIVNAPAVAIMGVSKSQIKPQWNGSEFVPRQMLPLAVSYDHRAINGADAGRFFTYLVSVLGDIRQLLL